MGDSCPPLVVAEIGINHGGDIETALNMVYQAHLSGCEAIKHQTHFVEDEMTSEARMVHPPNASESIWDVINKCSLSREEEVRLKCYTEELGMLYLSTPFSRAAADFLHSIGVCGYKIGSGECNHLPLIRHVAKFGQPMIVSTGMHSIEEIMPTVHILEEESVQFALLECTNVYPCPPAQVSLSGISELRTAFPKAIVGFSDHAIGPEMSLAAVACGAKIIERHFTDSRYRTGPDISCSMDPTELKYIIDRSREIALALVSRKKRTTGEQAVYAFARSSVVAERDLEAGRILSECDIWARRPGNGEISVDHFYDVVGKRLVHSVKRNQQLRWQDLENSDELQ